MSGLKVDLGQCRMALMIKRRMVVKFCREAARVATEILARVWQNSMFSGKVISADTDIVKLASSK